MKAESDALSRLISRAKNAVADQPLEDSKELHEWLLAGYEEKLQQKKQELTSSPSAMLEKKHSGRSLLSLAAVAVVIGSMVGQVSEPDSRWSLFG